jgi:hypothetical protein
MNDIDNTQNKIKPTDYLSSEIKTHKNMFKVFFMSLSVGIIGSIIAITDILYKSFTLGLFAWIKSDYTFSIEMIIFAIAMLISIPLNFKNIKSEKSKIEKLKTLSISIIGE